MTHKSVLPKSKTNSAQHTFMVSENDNNQEQKIHSNKKKALLTKTWREAYQYGQSMRESTYTFKHASSFQIKLGSIQLLSPQQLRKLLPAAFPLAPAEMAAAWGNSFEGRWPE